MPVHKKEDKNSLKNHRPISLLLISGKFCIVGSLGEKMGQSTLHCNILKCSLVSTNQTANHFLAEETQV